MSSHHYIWYSLPLCPRTSASVNFSWRTWFFPVSSIVNRNLILHSHSAFSNKQYLIWVLFPMIRMTISGRNGMEKLLFSEVLRARERCKSHCGRDFILFGSYINNNNQKVFMNFFPDSRVETLDTGHWSTHAVSIRHPVSLTVLKSSPCRKTSRVQRPCAQVYPIMKTWFTGRLLFRPQLYFRKQPHPIIFVVVHPGLFRGAVPRSTLVLVAKALINMMIVTTSVLGWIGQDYQDSMKMLPMHLS